MQGQDKKKGCEKPHWVKVNLNTLEHHLMINVSLEIYEFRLECINPFTQDLQRVSPSDMGWHMHTV